MEALARERSLEELVVRDAMSHPVRTCLLEDDLATAHARMRGHRVRRLVVTDGAGAVVGVLSLDDLAQVTTRHSPGATAEDLAATLRAARPV
jgi:CBS domain-containing protein